MEGLLTAEPFVVTDDEPVDAIFEPCEPPVASVIRRAPTTSIAVEIDPSEAAAHPSGPRVTMSHERYLELDRTLHELYSLCEIAIAQRDDARARAESAESDRQLYASRLKEWKTYAAKLERRLHASQIEEVQTAHRAQRAVDLAEEAIRLGPFSRGRRQALAEKLEAFAGSDEG